MKHHDTTYPLGSINKNTHFPPTIAQSRSSTLLHTSFWLAFWKSLIVPATQPLQVIMRMQQAAVKNRNVMPIVATANMLRSKQNGNRIFGVPTAFFRGTLPAVSKEAIKNFTYKAILFKGAPKLAAAYCPHSELHNSNNIIQHLSITTSAALIATISDTAIGGPFERFATYRTTSQGHLKDASFIQEIKKHTKATDKFKFIYQGSSASLLKTGIACFTLFTAAGPMQKIINQAYHLQPGDNIPLSASAITAFFTGSAVAVMSSPFDIVKTIQQMPKTTHTGSTLAIIHNNVKALGISAITAGLPIKMFMTILGWGAVSAITQQTKTVPENYTYRYT